MADPDGIAYMARAHAWRRRRWRRAQAGGGGAGGGPRTTHDDVGGAELAGGALGLARSWHDRAAGGSPGGGDSLGGAGQQGNGRGAGAGSLAAFEADPHAQPLLHARTHARTHPTALAHAHPRRPLDAANHRQRQRQPAAPTPPPNRPPAHPAHRSPRPPCRTPPPPRSAPRSTLSALLPQPIHRPLALPTPTRAANARPIGAPAPSSALAPAPAGAWARVRRQQQRWALAARRVLGATGRARMAPETSPRAGSVPRRAPPRLAALAAPALQFLPTPLLVLSADKRVVLANRAMGRLVDVAQWPDRGGRNATIADVLRGLSLDELGIEMLQQGRLAWVSWDLFLDTVMKDAACRSANIDDDTADLPDSSVDVVVMSLHKLPTDLPSGGEVRAKMIVSLWEHDGERYLNLSFTSVPRSRSLTVSSDSSASPEELHSATASPVSAPEPKQPTVELPSIGAGLWNNPSIPLVLRKVARMKDVLLDAMDMPVYVMVGRSGWPRLGC